MAINNIDLTNEIRDWKEAVCGEEVRAANVSAFEKIQGSVNDAINDVNITVVNVQRTSEDVNYLVDQVDVVLDEATRAKDIATQKATAAAEDAATAQEAAQRAEFYADLVIPVFHVNFANGHLEYTSDEDIIFAINYTTGNLEYRFAA